ncbi:MAG: phosphoribosylglycinamide formyltransferase [Thiotrichaceae bacterium]
MASDSVGKLVDQLVCKSIVVLVSGKGSNLQAIIDAVETAQISATISAVISNVSDAYALKRANNAGIVAEVVDHTQFDSRESFDAALQNVIEQYNPDLVVLSGFMRLLTQPFVEFYEGRMLNIHPSLLPKYRGLNTHQRALDAGDYEHGASVHFVTPDLDSGPAIIQAVVAIEQDDTVITLAKKVFKEEHIIYPLAISWFVEGRLKMKSGQAELDNQVLSSPVIHKDK